MTLTCRLNAIKEVCRRNNKLPNAVATEQDGSLFYAVLI